MREGLNLLKSIEVLKIQIEQNDRFDDGFSRSIDVCRDEIQEIDRSMVESIENLRRVELNEKIFVDLCDELKRSIEEQRTQFEENVQRNAKIFSENFDEETTSLKTFLKQIERKSKSIVENLRKISSRSEKKLDESIEEIEEIQRDVSVRRKKKKSKRKILFLDFFFRTKFVAANR